MKPLLAKSGKGDRAGRSLLGHTRDVVTVFEHLFGKPGRPTRLGRQWAAFFKVDDGGAFLHHGIAAAWAHDWGKANGGFQAALVGADRQLVRHEHLSAMLLNLPDVRKWLSARDDLDQDLIIAAVADHHLKCAAGTFAEPQGLGVDDSMSVLGAHTDFKSILAEMAAALGLPAALPYIATSLWCYEPLPGDTDANAHRLGVRDQLTRFDDALKTDPGRHCLFNAVRAALIAADSAGSGLDREGCPIPTWIDSAFDEAKLLDGDAVRDRILQPRVDQLIARGRWKDWSDFQRACEHLPDRALLLAPCGSGKTLAAWKWIAARLDARPAARVIFLYPTRGTATEGFRDYVAWAPEEDAALVHGTADYELDGMFDDADDTRGEKSFETEARLFALRQWTKRIFSATVDQFLAFLQFSYQSVCHLPLLADSVVVIDEVHSFDRGMFSALQDFLTHFNVPVLCMTATLPQDRRAALEACGLETYPREMPDDLRRSATYRRYRVRLTTEGDATRIVRDALRESKRVLWVVNNVKRCQTIARGMAADPVVAPMRTEQGMPVFCYHSRFRLEHRNAWHKAVVDAFRWTGGPRVQGVLAVTTQVCEMSLDLDADVVVTESAPATALIQRMGRGCREPLPANGRVAEVWVYPPADEKPYTPEQMNGVAEFVKSVAAIGDASQADLDALLADMPQAVELKTHCRFIDGGPWATAGEESFRDTDAFTRPAVLPEEVEDYARLRRGREAHKADGLVLPVPVYLAKGRAEQLPSWLAVAEGGHYVPTLGYLDEPRPADAWII